MLYASRRLMIDTKSNFQIQNMDVAAASKFHERLPRRQKKAMSILRTPSTYYTVYRLACPIFQYHWPTAKIQIHVLYLRGYHFLREVNHACLCLSVQLLQYIPVPMVDLPALSRVCTTPLASYLVQHRLSRGCQRPVLMSGDPRLTEECLLLPYVA